MNSPNERELRAYVHDALLPIYRFSLGILDYRALLGRELEGVYVIDALEGSHADAVAGGGRDLPGGSGRLHARLLGLSFDLDSFLSDIRSGNPRAQRVHFTWTPFLGFLSSVVDAMRSCVLPRFPDLQAQESAAFHVTNSIEFVEALAGFFESYVNASPAHDRVAFFLWSLRKNHPELLRAAYPNLDLGSLSETLGLSTFTWAPGVHLVGYPEYNRLTLYNMYGPSAHHGLLRRFLDEGACRSLGGAISLIIDALWLYSSYSPDIPLLHEYLDGLEDPASKYFGLVEKYVQDFPCNSGDLRGSAVHFQGSILGLSELLWGPGGLSQFYGLREYFLFRGPHGDRILCLNRRSIAR
ncbi:MAG: hypothetical protein RAK18_00915 [Conexivisphaerales archaeon]|nr:hypothetical protein [Conexivisphaerales archaeon]